MTAQGAQCPIPPELLPSTEAFKDYYMKAHTGRKLTWQMNMGTVDMKVRREYHHVTHPVTLCMHFLSGTTAC